MSLDLCLSKWKICCPSRRYFLLTTYAVLCRVRIIALPVTPAIQGVSAESPMRSCLSGQGFDPDILWGPKCRGFTGRGSGPLC